MRTLLNKIIYALVEWCKNTGRVYYITGSANKQEEVYLVRYIVLKSKWMCIYIHRFMRSDSSDPHDHPWNFITYIVSGGYTEVFYNREMPVKDLKTNRFVSYWTKKLNTRVPGSFAFRRATDIHRVVVDRKYSLFELEQAPLTACIMFNRQRNWGFWPLKDEGSKFVDWRRYLRIRPKDPRIAGSE